MYVSITSFKVKNRWVALLFQLHALASFFQARKSKGILRTETFSPISGVYNTLTHWESKLDMLKFRNRGAHLKAMKASGKLGYGIATGWETARYADRDTATERLHSEKGSLISPDEARYRLD